MIKKYLGVEKYDINVIKRKINELENILKTSEVTYVRYKSILKKLKDMASGYHKLIPLR